jgi:hypothetical protein
MSHLVTQRIVLHRNGDPIHFDITVDFQKLAETKGWKAEQSRSHRTKVAEGAVTVEHVP